MVSVSNLEFSGLPKDENIPEMSMLVIYPYDDMQIDTNSDKILSAFRQTQRFLIICRNNNAYGAIVYMIIK